MIASVTDNKGYMHTEFIFIQHWVTLVWQDKFGCKKKKIHDQSGIILAAFSYGIRLISSPLCLLFPHTSTLYFLPQSQIFQKIWKSCLYSLLLSWWLFYAVDGYFLGL